MHRRIVSPHTLPQAEIDTAILKRLRDELEFIYGPDAALEYLPRIINAVVNNPVAPRQLDLSQKTAILIAYADHVQSEDESPLATLHRFAKTTLHDTVDTVHLLPHYPTTLNGGFTDGGFAVSDYEAVRPEFGTWADVRALGDDYSLMFDFVLNHTSVSHRWFQAFLQDDPQYRDYYIAVDPATDLRQVFRPRAQPLLTPFEAPSGTKHVWTTFSTAQPDLNYANPAVLIEMVEILLFYVRQGADFVRLDAPGFIWKEIGTSCLHHPKTHAIMRLLRAVMDAYSPWVRLISETNVPHVENISYFGDGRNEAQLVYNFALPPLTVHSLQTGNAEALSAWAATLETPSNQTTFFNFTASHDGIGVRGANDILTPEEIAEMCHQVTARGGLLSMKNNPDGSQSVYEMNISFFNAVTLPEDQLELAVDKFICSQAIMLALRGVPGIYFHSLIGSTNWTAGVEKSHHNRDINREKVLASDVNDDMLASDSRRHLVLERYRQLLTARSQEPAFHPVAPQHVLDLGPQLFALERVSPAGGRVWTLQNVSDQTVTLDLPAGAWSDLLASDSYTDTIELPPYAVKWLKYLPSE